ncbi:MAG: hypothetical protein G8345_05935 [Magnetococcales bacterium]|nr:hypothetical protein [Magnetococcales bacterium]NGZ26409.1 hypothetical protein [Magnetococcales bacterium]
MKISSIVLFVLIAYLGNNSALANVDSSQCGSLCHVPMAWQGGSGPMAWSSLGPRNGTFEQMRMKLGVPSQQWRPFETAVLQTDGLTSGERNQQIYRQFRQMRHPQ